MLEAEPTMKTYPKCDSIIDVTQPPYSAKGDGITDNTAVLQLAFNENVGRHRILYFPPGTYLVSATGNSFHNNSASPVHRDLQSLT